MPISSKSNPQEVIQMNKIDKTYSIGAVAKMTGITKGKLRH